MPSVSCLFLTQVPLTSHVTQSWHSGGRFGVCHTNINIDAPFKINATVR